MYPSNDIRVHMQIGQAVMILDDMNPSKAVCLTGSESYTLYQSIILMVYKMVDNVN